MALGNQELTAGADGLLRTSGDIHVEGATHTWRRGQLYFVTSTEKGLIKKLFVRAIMSISV